jgi:hypothetical protein
VSCFHQSHKQKAPGTSPGALKERADLFSFVFAITPKSSSVTLQKCNKKY